MIDEVSTGGDHERTAGEMTAVLIFSKDRALQLDGMLRSFLKWAADADLANITVLYTTTQERLHKQYVELEREYGTQARFVRETDFRSQVLNLVGTKGRAAPHQSGRRPSHLPGRPDGGNPVPVQSTSQVLFLVDDTIFFRPFSLRVAAEALDSSRRALGFSFRLGGNTVHSYALRTEQSLPSFQHLAHGVMEYEWVGAEGDFAYPFELSSSMYRAETISDVLKRLPFVNPNTLESQMSLSAKRYRRHLPLLLCWTTSVAFSAPANRVQDVFENRSGAQAELSVQSLADIFDAGKRMDIGKFEGFMPTACHQEVSLTFKPAVVAAEDRN